MTDLPAFASPGDLSTALRTPITDVAQWSDALDDASGYLRYIIGQPINAGTATLNVWTDERGIAELWLVPVTSISSVIDDRGLAVADDRWELIGQDLHLGRGRSKYTVTLAYGYTEIPREIVRWTKALAAAQLATAARGSLGLSGGVTSVAIDDGKVTYSDAMAVALPDSTAQRLKAMYGGPQ